MSLYLIISRLNLKLWIASIAHDSSRGTATEAVAISIIATRFPCSSFMSVYNAGISHNSDASPRAPKVIRKAFFPVLLGIIPAMSLESFTISSLVRISSDGKLFCISIRLL